MPKRKDYTGMQFGRLTAISFDHMGNHGSYWLCKCECGKEVVRRMDHMRKNASCGCYMEEVMNDAKERREIAEKKKQEYRSSRKKRRDLTGEKIGLLKVKKLISDLGEKAQYECECECGKIVIKSQTYLISSHYIHSCGCNRKRKRDGITVKENRLTGIYNGMISRCYNENDSNYKNYGGRGIKVAKWWLGEDGLISFIKWAKKNGYSDDLTIDRINVNGNYSPHNCRWVDNMTQANNKRNSIRVYMDGKVYTAREFSEKYSLSYNIIQGYSKDNVYSGEYLLSKKIHQKKGE